MLEKGKKVGEYVLLEKLGAGGFGDVWKAEKRTVLDVNHFALKFFRPKQNGVDFDKIGKELAVWKQLRGLPHIISVIELDRFEDYVYVVSDFADGGSLENWLKNNGGKASTETEAVQIALEILTGLENLHGKNFVHRDLKPDNILIMNGRHCLADFGISREIKTHSKATGTAGTMEYMPPEAFDKTPSVTPQTDIWAVGAILQRLLTGKLPYPQDDQPSLIAAILMSEPDEMPETVSQSLREIVRKSLQKKREDRFQSASEMREVLRDVLKSSQKVETVEIEDSDKTAKYEIAPIQQVIPIVQDNEIQPELRSFQTEVKTVVRQQINKEIGQIDESLTHQEAIDYQTLSNRQTALKTSVKKLKPTWIVAIILLISCAISISLFFWSDIRNLINPTTSNSTNKTVNKTANNTNTTVNTNSVNNSTNAANNTAASTEKNDGKTVSLDAAGVKITVPKAFKHEKDGDAILVTTPDDGVFVVFSVPGAAEDFEAAVKESAKTLDTYMKDVKVEAKDQKDTINGMEAIGSGGSGVDKESGKAVEWRLMAVKTDKKPVLIIIYGEKASLEKHQKDGVALMSSLKKQ